MLQSLLGLVVLLVQQVIQDILVPLYQPLRVLLSVLQLLIPVPLDPLEESGEGQLLAVPKFGFLLLQQALHLRLELAALELLE